MPRSNSKKMVCPTCFQIARTTDPHPALMCARCCTLMKVAPSRSPVLMGETDAVVVVGHSGSLLDDAAPPEPSLEDLNRSLDE